MLLAKGNIFRNVSEYEARSLKAKGYKEIKHPKSGAPNKNKKTEE